MQWELTDAYAHVGLPRFGSADQLLRYLDVQGTHQAVAVLGPLVPDIDTKRTFRKEMIPEWNIRYLARPVKRSAASDTAGRRQG